LSLREAKRRSNPPPGKADALAGRGVPQTEHPVTTSTPILSQAASTNRLKTASGVYDHATGRVNLL
jgi:hypothetical protein